MTGPSIAERSWTAGRLLRRSPVTVTALVALLAAGIATGSLVSGPSRALLAAVGAGVHQPVWTLLTSAFWSARPTRPTAWPSPASSRSSVRPSGGWGAGCGLPSWWPASSRASPPGCPRPGSAATGDVWARELSAMVVVGPFPGAAGRRRPGTPPAMPALWRRRLRLSVSIILLALVLYSGTAGDVVRLSAGCSGSAAGPLLHPLRRARVAAPHPSRRETRALVALVVAVTAIGPLARRPVPHPRRAVGRRRPPVRLGRPPHALLRIGVRTVGRSGRLPRAAGPGPAHRPRTGAAVGAPRAAAARPRRGAAPRTARGVGGRRRVRHRAHRDRRRRRRHGAAHARRLAAPAGRPPGQPAGRVRRRPAGGAAAPSWYCCWSPGPSSGCAPAPGAARRWLVAGGLRARRGDRRCTSASAR